MKERLIVIGAILFALGFASGAIVEQRYESINLLNQMLSDVKTSVSRLIYGQEKMPYPNPAKFRKLEERRFFTFCPSPDRMSAVFIERWQSNGERMALNYDSPTAEVPFAIAVFDENFDLIAIYLDKNLDGLVDEKVTDKLELGTRSPCEDLPNPRV
jgi:hypothetical protein